MTPASDRDRRIWLTYGTILFGLGFLYVAFCLSPSSYALALRLLGAEHDGLVLGRVPPLRSDEWAVWTPYLQIAVNNGFERFNLGSPYGEDLRNFNALPLADWGIAFKPHLWAFFLIDPAYAFSISHALIYLAFLIGWPLFLRRLGFEASLSILGGLCLFFTSYAQQWWTTTGPLLAGFPWIAVIALSALRPAIKAPLLAWATACWLLSHLYPPIILTLGYAGTVAVLAFRRDALTGRNLAVALPAAAAAAAIAYLYLAEPIRVMSQTVYPGAREIPPGLLPPLMWLAQFFPFLGVSGDTTLIGLNLLEVATGGTYLTLLAAVFLDHRAVAQLLLKPSAEQRGIRLSAVVLGAALAFASLWLLLPVPAILGRPLFWHLVPAQRFVFALGLIWLLLVLTFLRVAPLRLTWTRAIVAALPIIGVWAWSKFGLAPPGTPLSIVDLAILIPLAAVVALRGRRMATPAALLVGAAMIGNAVGFGTFNPLQSAWPIFHRPETATTQLLAARQVTHPQGWLAVPGYLGGVLNGWGFRSVSHVLILPQVAFFRQRFPDMPEAEIQRVFNRYGHIILRDVAAPYVPQGDAIVVPLAAFDARPLQSATLGATAGAPPPPDLPKAGNVDNVEIDGRSMRISGWAYVDGRTASPRLIIHAPGLEKVIALQAQARPDVVAALMDARLALAGFEVTVTFSQEASAARLCLWSDDPTMGQRLLSGTTC
jgi:hypothetical protein